MKISEDEIHVGLGEDEVKPGDKVLFYKNVCHRPLGSWAGARGTDPHCERQLIGEGRVRQVLGRDYSIVTVNHDPGINEGMVVEKK